MNITYGEHEAYMRRERALLPVRCGSELDTLEELIKSVKDLSEAIGASDRQRIEIDDLIESVKEMRQTP